MIYVRVEMWPWGNRERAYVLGEATICNVGGNSTRGDYDVALSSTSPVGRNGGFGPRSPQEAANRSKGDGCVYRRAEVKNYPRLSLVMWHLIARALGAAVGEPSLKNRTRKTKEVVT